MFIMCTHLYLFNILSSCLFTYTHTLATLPFSGTCLTMVHVVNIGTAMEVEAGGAVVVGGVEEEIGGDKGLKT